MGRVLLASPDTYWMEAMAAAVTALGHEALTVTDGRQAYETALQTHPDIVFLDVALPVFNGFEVCQRIRSDPDFPSTLPVFLLTALEANPKKLEAVKGTGYFPKGTVGYKLNELLARYLAPGTPGR